MTRVQAHRGDSGVLARARGGVHLHAQVPGDSNRGHAHPVGGGVDQQPLSCLGPGQVHERIPRGQVHRGHSGRLGERPSLRDGGYQPLVGDRYRADATRRHPHNPVTDHRPKHLRPGFDDDAGHKVDEAGGKRDIPEAQAGGADGDADLPPPQRRFGVGVGQQGQVLHGAAFGHI